MSHYDHSYGHLLRISKERDMMKLMIAMMILMRSNDGGREKMDVNTKKKGEGVIEN